MQSYASPILLENHTHRACKIRVGFAFKHRRVHNKPLLRRCVAVRCRSEKNCFAVFLCFNQFTESTFLDLETFHLFRCDSVDEMFALFLVIAFANRAQSIDCVCFVRAVFTV